MTSTSWTKTTSRRLAALVAVSLLALPASAQDEVERAVADLRVTVDMVLAVLGDASLDADGKLDKLLEVGDARFDLPVMTKLVLGRQRRKLSEEQQAEFQKEFTRHLTLTYGDTVDQFAGEQVEIGDGRLEAKGDVTIKTRIVDGGGEGIQIAYRLRERDGTFLVIDVIPEGVSVILNFRAQVKDLVGSKGADQLITTIREKNEKEAAARAVGSD